MNLFGDRSGQRERARKLPSAAFPGAEAASQESALGLREAPSGRSWQVAPGARVQVAVGRGGRAAGALSWGVSGELKDPREAGNGRRRTPADGGLATARGLRSGASPGAAGRGLRCAGRELRSPEPALREAGDREAKRRRIRGRGGRKGLGNREREISKFCIPWD